MGICKNLFTESDIVQLTQDLIRIPSDWNQPERERQVLDYICSFFDKHGIAYTLQFVEGNRYNIIATHHGTGGGKSLLLNGHVDTVPAYEMDFPPYEAFIKDGFVHGRGSVDMKGAIAAMMMSLVVCKRGNIPLKGDLHFSAVVGEEGSSEGTEALVLGNFKADGAIVGEPSNFDYAIGHRGLVWLEIKVLGKTAHSGVTEQGINAISKAAKLIVELENVLGPRLKQRVNPFTGASVLNFGRIEGGTQPSTVADICKIQLDRRYIPEESTTQVIDEICAVINRLETEDPDFLAELQIMENSKMKELYHVPMITDQNSEIVTSLTKTIREVTGSDPEISTRRGWTDGGLLSSYLNIPTVICGPGDISYSHSKNEKISVQQLVEAVEIYVGTAMKFCGI